MKNFFGRYIIIPYFLQKAGFLTKDILMRDTMRCIKTTNIHPALFSLNCKNNSKRNISPTLC